MDSVTDKLTFENLDKSNWLQYRFDEIASSVSERVEPSETDLEVYVGLEHLDSESIHIKRFGSPTDVKGTKLKVYPGDVIFGKRRAYQRKAAIAEFEGICSAHAMVLRANPEIIDPKLFPFFLHSDAFMHRAVDISVGSLSPTINWKTLRKQEFLLPPKDQQARLAELLWAADEVVERGRELQERADMYSSVTENSLVLEGIQNNTFYSDKLKRQIASNWKEATLGELQEAGYILKVQDGNHGEIHPKSADYVQEGIPFIMANSLNNGIVDLENSKKLPQSITDILRVGFSYPGDVLLSHKGTVGQVALVEENIAYPYLMLTPQVTYYRTNPDKLNGRFLFFVFRSRFFQNQLRRLSSQSTRAYVGIKAQERLKVVVPKSLKEQSEVVELLNEIESARSLLANSIKDSQLLLKSLLHQIFSP